MVCLSYWVRIFPVHVPHASICLFFVGLVKRDNKNTWRSKLRKTLRTYTHDRHLVLSVMGRFCSVSASAILLLAATNLTEVEELQWATWVGLQHLLDLSTCLIKKIIKKKSPECRYAWSRVLSSKWLWKIIPCFTFSGTSWLWPKNMSYKIGASFNYQVSKLTFC